MLTVTLRYTRRLGMVTRASLEYCFPQKPTSTNRSVPIHVRPKPCPFQSTSVPIHVRLIHIRPNPCPSQSLSISIHVSINPFTSESMSISILVRPIFPNLVSLDQIIPFSALSSRWNLLLFSRTEPFSEFKATSS